MIKKKNNLVITTSSFNKTLIKKYSQNFHSIKFNPFGRKLKKEEIIKLCKNADVIIAGTEIYDRQIIEKLKYLKVIYRIGVGIDNIDLETAKNKKIKILKNKVGPTDSVAEFILTLILIQIKKIIPFNNILSSGVWEKDKTYMLQETIVGIIGMGKIGKRLSKILKFFGSSIIYFDNVVSNKKLKKMSIGEIFKKSDIVVICLPLNKDTKNLINLNLLKNLKANSALINTSRGGIVNEKDILKFLKNNQNISYYADVFSEEPYNGKLINIENAIKSPHVAGSANLIRDKMELEAIKFCATRI